MLRKKFVSSMWVSATLSSLPQMDSSIIHSKGLQEQGEMSDGNNSDVDDKKVVFSGRYFPSTCSYVFWFIG